MGNEKSQPTGLLIDETAREVTDSWSLHGATFTVGSVPKISVFVTSCNATNKVTHLDKFTKNVMIYRHPSILKYIANWRKGSKLYLATEQVQPLAQVLPSQTSLQICVGLQNILKALVFLHESGLASHNNVCRAAIYVSQGGSWKLGGLEYLCRFNEMSSGYLEETRKSRYEPAVAPNEANHLPEPLYSVDCYAFGVLVLEVLANKNTDDVHGMSDFLDVCKRQLTSSNPEARPSLASLMTHPFFCHEFLTIHNFLVDLPIKKENEKQEFFRGLVAQLSLFPAPTVASQLGSLLLSRLVLLDPTAQVSLLPHLFTPKHVDSDDSLFSESVFKTHMVPRLLPLFCVRDVQIRLILLKHFSSFCTLFSKIQLQTRILPELLVGIKDTNDTLVSSTLRALAEVVPELGGEVVIGGKRAKLFADGRPKVVKSSTKQSLNLPSNTEPNLFADGVGVEGLPERPSPDGGEHTPLPSEEDEAWPDWDDKATGNAESGNHLPDNSEDILRPDSVQFPDKNRTVNNIESGIRTLELKLKPKVTDEFDDIFRDMEPVISKPQIIHIKEEVTSDKFALSSEVCGDTDGWGEDLDCWNDDEAEHSCNKSVTNS